jgi:hypothetical protein
MAYAPGAGRARPWIGHQAGAVRVIAQDNAVRPPGQRVDGAGGTGPPGEAVGELERLQFVRKGDVDAEAAAGMEVPQALLELTRRNVDANVIEMLARLSREAPVDERRLAVSDRVADHRIQVGGLAHHSLSQEAACLA